MLTREEATARVEQFASAWKAPAGAPADPLVVVHERTLEKPYGWVFDLEPLSWRRGGRGTDFLVDVGYVVVLRDTGEVIHLGCHMPPDEVLAEFEAGLPDRNRGRR